MMQEDSNGETGFEFVERKPEEPPAAAAVAERADPPDSSMPSSTSSSAAVSLLPSPAGNILSSVPPPSQLPSFVVGKEGAVRPPGASLLPPGAKQPTADASKPDIYYPTKFSAAIPPNKGIMDPGPVVSTEIPLGVAEEAAGASIFGWMKGAVSSGGGILSKVAEKAKSSVDSMITTLDPQMREFLNSGGDIDIIVASDKESKISPIREAFQAAFGKATVEGKVAQASNVAVQPIGFENGIKAAEERIASILTTGVQVPIVAVENFIARIEDKWYDLGVVVLRDPIRSICLHTFTQMTPIPAAVVAAAEADTPPDYPLKATGFAVPIGGILASNLQVSHTEWHRALCGVSRREMVLLAAKTLAGLYKNSIKI